MLCRCRPSAERRRPLHQVVEGRHQPQHGGQLVAVVRFVVVVVVGSWKGGPALLEE